MTHTLNAYYYPGAATTAAATTLAFTSAVSLGTTGLQLTAYDMGMPSTQAARNSSLYSDAPRPQYSRRTTVVDTLTFDVRGSSYSALYTLLHQVAQLGEYARLAMEHPHARSVAYMEFRPNPASAGETVYAAIYDARLSMPADWAANVTVTNEIRSVVLVIERDIWRAAAPVIGFYAEGWPQAGVTVLPMSAAKGSVGGASFTIVPKGDIQALGGAYVGSIASGAIDHIILGYRSAALGGANHATLGKRQCEAATFGIIADTTAGADATASGGQAAITTFATSASSTIRFTGGSIPHGVHRVFARVRVTAGTTAKLKIGYQDETNALGAVWATNDAVTVTSSTYVTVDLGPISIYQSVSTLMIDDAATGCYAIYAERTAGAGSLYVDYLFLMPTEGYVRVWDAGITAANAFAMMHDETGFAFKGAFIVSALSAAYNARVRLCRYSGELNIKPGAGTFYWITGQDSGGNILDSLSTTEPSLSVRALARYLTPVAA